MIAHLLIPPDSFGYTLLHYAAWNSTVELLLRHGSISLDSLDINGRTPLHLAIMNGRDSTVKILKAVGATILSIDLLNSIQIEKFQAPIPKEEILEIRPRIYFVRSLTSCLL